MAAEEGKEEAGLDLDQVEEEFSVWKRNTPFLYDLMISNPLEWPSLTLYWVTSKPIPYAKDPYFNIHKLILGTHTSGGAQDFLMVADVVIIEQSGHLASSHSLQAHNSSVKMKSPSPSSSSACNKRISKWPSKEKGILGPRPQFQQQPINYLSNSKFNGNMSKPTKLQSKAIQSTTCRHPLQRSPANLQQKHKH